MDFYVVLIWLVTVIAAFVGGHKYGSQASAELQKEIDALIAAARAKL